jgi:hypothetical protein
MKAHFSELLLFLVLITMLGFSMFMAHGHNDSLATKGMEFTGQALAALLTLMVASKQSPPEAGTSTSTTTTNTASATPPPKPENLALLVPPAQPVAEVPHV